MRTFATAFWIALFSLFGCWLAGWALGVLTWVPGMRSILGSILVALGIEVLALANKAEGDTLSEVMRYLARKRTLFPWVWGIVAGAGLLLGVQALRGMLVEWKILQVCVIVSTLAGLSGHFFFPPTKHTRELATIPRAFSFGALHGLLCVLASIVPGGELMLVIVAASAIWQGSVFFALTD